MGASVSKNTAEAMASVTNTIENSTTVTNEDFTNQTNNINLNNCSVDVKNDINVKQYAEQLAKNHQIANGLSNTDLQNDIQQKMMQQAMSSVGSMGIGYADANNSASMFASASNDVSNEVKTVSKNIIDSSNDINCNDSVIRAKNINITQGLNNQYINDQVAKSDNITKISNTISQTAQQKATAKVAGLAVFIIALAILIIALGWSFSEVAQSVPGVRAIVIVVVIILFIVVIILLYMYKVPPLFNEPLQCSPNFSYGTGKNDCSASCINATTQDVLLDHTPMKYIFSIVGDPPANSGTTGSLLNMVVSSQTSSDNLQNNQGYTASNAQNINKQFINFINNLDQNILVDKDNNKIKIPDILVEATDPKDSKSYLKIPDEFMKAGTNGKNCSPQSIQLSAKSSNDYHYSSCSDVNSGNCYNINDKTTDATEGGACLNIDEWNTLSTQNPGLARFLLLRFIESPDDQLKFDLTMYEDDNDPVVYKENNIEKIDLAKNVKDKVTKYYNNKSPIPSSIGKSGSGKLTGLIGKCNNQSYKLQVGVRKVFWYGLPTLLMIFFIYEVIRYHGKGGTFSDWVKPISAILIIYIAFIVIMALLWRPWK